MAVRFLLTAFLIFILACNPIRAAVFTVMGGNGESITIEVTGIQNINVITNPNTGQPTNHYTYRRIGQEINFTISTQMAIQGNSCDSSYNYGLYACTVRKVTGFNPGPYSTPYGATITKNIKSKRIIRGQGSVNYNYQYSGKSAIVVEIFQYLEGLSVCPLDTPQQVVQMSFMLVPEPIASEILYTRQLHPDPERDDMDYWQDENCNSCVPMGLPSYQVNTSTFLPEFKEVDYSYRCGNRVLNMERFYVQPVREHEGMFGVGWGMAYESYIQKADYSEGIADVSWMHPNGKEVQFIMDGNKFKTESNHRDVLTYDSLAGVYFVKEHRTGLTYRFQQSAIDTLRYLLKSIKDNYHTILTINHNSNDRITSLTDACGNSTSFTYNAQGLCSRINLANGKKIEFTYDSNRRLITNTDVYGNAIQFAYNSDHFITSFSVNGNTASITYSTNGLLSSVSSITNLNGVNTQFSLMPSPPIFTAQRQGSNQTNTYHSNLYTGSVTKSIRGNVEVSRTFDKKLLLKTRSYANGVTETFTYDSLTNNLISYSSKDASIYLLAYDSLNNLTEVTDPNGRKRGVQYNAQGYITATKDRDNSWRYYTYNAAGQISTRTDELGAITSYTYNTDGNLSKVTYPDGTFAEYIIEKPTGNLLQYKNRNGGILTYTYDALNRVTKMTNEDGTFKEYAYDCCSQTGFKDELGNMLEMQRSPTTRILSVKDAENNLVAFGYNAEGRVTTLTYPDGSTRQLAYNSAGLPVTITDENGNSIQYQYDANGYVSAMTDEKGQTSTFTNTPSGRLSSATTPGSGTVERVYDATGRINHIINARQQFIPITRDLNQRITAVASDNLTSTYTYNAKGKVVAYAGTKGIVTLTRDTMQRVMSENHPSFGQVNYNYNANGLLTSMQYPGNVVQLQYVRNQRGFITAIVINNSDTILYARNAVGDVTSVQYPNQIVQRTAFDKNQNIISHYYQNSMDTLLGFWYQIDNRNNIVSERRVMPAGTGSVIIPSDTGGYFQADNLVNQWHNNSFSHDADGNLASCTGGLNFTMQHNSVNLPTQLITNGNQTRFYYNTRSFADVVKSNLATYFYCYDYRGNLIAIKDSSNGNTTFFIYDDKKLIAAKTGTDIYFYLTNHVGSVYAVASASGQFVNTYNYNVWGQITHQQEAFLQPFKYIGAYGVREVIKDFYQMKHRIYNSYLGRFLEKDPMGYTDGTNPYVYAANNPLKYIDPLGLYYNDLGNSLSNGWNRFMNYNKSIVDKIFPQQKPKYDTEFYIEMDNRLGRIGDVCSWIAPWIPGVEAGQAAADGKGWEEILKNYGQDILFSYFGGKLSDEKLKMLLESVDNGKNALGTIDALYDKDTNDNPNEPIEAQEWEAEGRQ